MERLYIRWLVSTAVFIAFVSSFSVVYAAKTARLPIVELLNSANTVAVVRVVSSKLTDQKQAQLHTTTQLSIIEHKAKILTPIKNTVDADEIQFTSTDGLKAGDKYIVFLSKSKNNKYQVMINNYGALAIAYVSLQQGVIEAVRVADSYIKLPKSLKPEAGLSAKNEQASYVWSNVKTVTQYLLKHKK